MKFGVWVFFLIMFMSLFMWFGGSTVVVRCGIGEDWLCGMGDCVCDGCCGDCGCGGQCCGWCAWCGALVEFDCGCVVRGGCVCFCGRWVARCLVVVWEPHCVDPVGGLVVGCGGDGW